jgi:hypothetical protein
MGARGSIYYDIKITASKHMYSTGFVSLRFRMMREYWSVAAEVLSGLTPESKTAY